MRSLALTSREKEVVDLIGDGLTNKEIAVKLGISRWSVKTHVEHALVKMDAKNRTHLVKLSLVHRKWSGY